MMIFLLGLFLCLSALLSRVLASSSSSLTPPASTPIADIPPWATDEIDICDDEFSYGNINTRDCWAAFEHLPSGPNAVRYANGARWPYRAPRSLPLIVSHGTCAIKFEASGRNASSVAYLLFVPDHIREMTAWIFNQCVLPSRRGGFVTRQVENTRSFLKNPYNKADFGAGFRESSSFLTISRLIHEFM